MKILVYCLLLSTTVLADEKSRFLLKDTNISVVEAGKKVYGTYCAACHGKYLQGQPNWETFGADGRLPAPPHDESGHTWHHPDEYLFLMTKYGIEKIIGKKYLNNMPAYKDILTDKEIIAVLSFIKSKWPNQIQDIHNNLNVRSKLN